MLDHAVHSGMFGGPVLDAPTLLARLIATLHDDAGRRRGRRPGRTRRTRPSTTTRPRSAPTPPSLDGVRLAGTGPITARLWTRPALGVIGFDAPSVAQRVEHDHAARDGEALACGIAPGQDPAAAIDALRDATCSRTRPFGARVTVTRRRARQAVPGAGRLARPCRPPAGRSRRPGARAPVDIGVGGLDPVHRRPARGVPGRGDPGHRRGGPGQPRARRQRVGAPRRAGQGRAGRGAAAGAARLRADAGCPLHALGSVAAHARRSAPPRGTARRSGAAAHATARTAATRGSPTVCASTESHPISSR